MNLLYHGNPLLNRKTVEVTNFNEDIKTVVSDMKKLMTSHRGIGLSLNQTDYEIPYKIFIMLLDNKGTTQEFINPKIEEEGKEFILSNEGCLSTPGIFVPIARPGYAVVSFKDSEGSNKMMETQNILTRCALH